MICLLIIVICTSANNNYNFLNILSLKPSKIPTFNIKEKEKPKQKSNEKKTAEFVESAKNLCFNRLYQLYSPFY